MSDPHHVTIALRAGGELRRWNDAGILSAADVHVARRLGAMAGEDDEAVLLAAALAVRSTRLGSVLVDLAAVAPATAADDGELRRPERWVERCATSPLAGGPLRLEGSRLWLGRYWDQEDQVARELRSRALDRPDDIDPAVLDAGLDRLFPHPDDEDQRAAAAACARSRVSVLAGGPGTGKTTTVARVIALLLEQHPAWRVALAAPTGKAAARLQEAVRSSSADLPAEDRRRLGVLSAGTLHRLLGWRPDARGRFRHDGDNRLPREVVVVDESSMLSLTLMARLLEALRPATRLVLVGDPDQLASVEAGAVLADLVAPADHGSPAYAVRRLTTNRRFSAAGGIAALAEAVRAGDPPAALAALRGGRPDVEFVEVDDDERIPDPRLGGVRADVTAAGIALQDAAARGDAAAAVAALDGHRLLCAHRTGPRGVTTWGPLAASWLAPDAHRGDLPPRADGHHLGEPLIVAANDYDTGLYNGDTGVVIDDGTGGLVAAFGRGDDPLLVPLQRLGDVEPLYAMTVHRSQGSQFDRISVVLPPAASRLATRQTLYTALTRARHRVRVIGSAAAFTAAVRQPAARATGLHERLAR